MPPTNRKRRRSLEKEEVAWPERQSLSALGCGRAARGSTGQRRYRSVNFSECNSKFLRFAVVSTGLTAVWEGHL
jgi:hypothetical protein